MAAKCSSVGWDEPSGCLEEVMMKSMMLGSLKKE